MVKVSKAWRVEGRKRQGRVKCKPGSKQMAAVKSQKGKWTSKSKANGLPKWANRD